MPLCSITPKDGSWNVRFQFDPLLVDAMREAGGKWDKAAYHWSFNDPNAIAVIERANAFSDNVEDFFLRVQSGMLAAANRVKMDPDLQKIGTNIPNNKKLRDFQVEGVRFMIEHEATLLADEMGTGKSIQVAALLNQAADLKRAIIICPASLKVWWYRVLRGDESTGDTGWLINKDLTVGMARGLYWPNTNIVIINYDILDRHKKRMDSIDWDFAIADEAHYIKSSATRRTQMLIGRRETKEEPAIRPLVAQRRIALSGTPLVNKPAEIWAVLNWLDAKRWPSFFWFAKKFCGATKGRFGYDYSGASNLDELSTRLRRTIMLRRTKKDVLKELPPKTRQVIEFDAPEILQDIESETKAINLIADRTETLRAAVELARINRNEAEYRSAIDALNGELKVQMEHVATLRRELAVAKIPYVVDHAKECLRSGDKLVIFAHHRDVIFGLNRELGKLYPTRYIIGGMEDGERQKSIDMFQSDPDMKVIVCSIQAAGVGITLTAASHVVFAELDWVPGNVSQCEDRLHRIGQVNPVLVQHLVAFGSLDARIAKRLIAKQEILDAVLDGKILDESFEPVAMEESNPPTQPGEGEIASIVSKMNPYMRACALYACKVLERDPPFGMSPVDKVIVSRFAVLSDLDERQAAYIAHVAQRYRGGWDWMNEAKHSFEAKLAEQDSQKTLDMPEENGII